MLTLLILATYTGILIMLVRQGLRGHKRTKANFSHFSKWGRTSLHLQGTKRTLQG